MTINANTHLKVLPAIDLLGGKVVRLVHGDYNRVTVYGEDPAAYAAEFLATGAEMVHVVDLDGAREGQPVNLPAIRAIVAATGGRVQVGGGLRQISHAQTLIDLGVARVLVGTRLANAPEEAERWVTALGDRLVATIDTRGGKVATEGWLSTSTTDGVDLARHLAGIGLRRVLTTDIARDGTLSGPDLDGLSRMARESGCRVIASGGVAQLSDLAAISATGCDEVVIGKALYEGRFTLAEALRATTAPA
jgi:phosphoribosylformimino-5-aminoimidazole carboxamide ribotide isomerase